MGEREEEEGPCLSTGRRQRSAIAATLHKTFIRGCHWHSLAAKPSGPSHLEWNVRSRLRLALPPSPGILHSSRFTDAGHPWMT